MVRRKLLAARHGNNLSREEEEEEEKKRQKKEGASQREEESHLATRLLRLQSWSSTSKESVWLRKKGREAKRGEATRGAGRKGGGGRDARTATVTAGAGAGHLCYLGAETAAIIQVREPVLLGVPAAICQIQAPHEGHRLVHHH